MGNNFGKSLAVPVTDIQACMYCKRADVGAGFMNTFSYCPDYKNQKCIQNWYMYINQYMKCVSGPPVEGWKIDIDNDCNAVVASATACPAEFVAYEGMPQKIVNK